MCIKWQGRKWRSHWSLRSKKSWSYADRSRRLAQLVSSTFSSNRYFNICVTEKHILTVLICSVPMETVCFNCYWIGERDSRWYRKTTKSENVGQEEGMSNRIHAFVANYWQINETDWQYKTLNHTMCLFYLKMTTTINRLAAVHRGTLRALQVVIHQLSDLSFNKLTPHYKALSQLIRQLSLCSAKVEVDQGSAVPETALNILEKLEVKSRNCIQNVFSQCFILYF